MRVSFEKMYEEFLRVLLKIGFTRERAELCAKLFTETSCDGVYSHGLNRFPQFIEYIQKGHINIHASPEKVDSSGVVERWDGNLGPGNLNAFFCMDSAIHIAHENGLGCVALKNTNHWMRAGSYGLQAAQEGCIGICWTNTMPLMPPWGSREIKFGNNPMVFAIPRPEGHIILDMAMTQFSFGKLNSYALRNELLPVEGGYDTSGKLTRDPEAIVKSGRSLSIGYWKGSGLALVLDLVAMLLSGGKSTYQLGKEKDEYGVSQIFIAIDLLKIAGESYVHRAVNEVIKDLHEAVPAEKEGSIYYPGERMLKTRKENLEKGIPVEPSYWQQVQEM